MVTRKLILDNVDRTMVDALQDKCNTEILLRQDIRIGEEQLMTFLGPPFSEELNYLGCCHFICMSSDHIFFFCLLFSLTRLLSKFLDSAQEDIIPWHECIDPCLSAVSAHVNDQEVGRRN